VSSDLFGHAKGAFTGADAARAGAIVATAGGTLFLDEIGKASKHVQGKLLRIVEEDGDFHPVGSDRAVRGDVRFIFAANEGLDALVEQDRFLADLRDRISAFGVRIPPLRERRADIADLVRHVASLRGARCGYADRPPSFDGELLCALENDSWPGNVRELAMSVERLMIDAAGATTITLAHCTGHLTRLRSVAGARRGTLTRPLVLQAIADAGGNKSAAAARLGVSRKTIHEYARESAVPSPGLTTSEP
jgi:two-component system response regulator HydG